MDNHPAVIDRYEILEEIGWGGMAVVYRAYQRGLSRDVALKKLLEGGHPSLARRFVRESHVVGSMNHPNIVTVFDYFEHDGNAYIAMEYLERGSLRPWVQRLSLTQVGGVLEGMLAGLAHAHALDVVHRDLKPENVLVTADGRVKIADFGIAKARSAVHEASMLTATGVAVGTPFYMSPEQAMARPIGPEADLYALGCMAYEMVTGQVPFSGGDSPLSVLLRHVSEPAPSASSVNAEVPVAVSDWIDRLLVKDPAGRLGSAQEAWDQFEEILVAAAGSRWARAARLLEPVARSASPASPEGGSPGGGQALPANGGHLAPVPAAEEPASQAPATPTPAEPVGDLLVPRRSGLPTDAATPSPASSPAVADDLGAGDDAQDGYRTFNSPQRAQPPVRSEDELPRILAPDTGPSQPSSGSRVDSSPPVEPADGLRAPPTEPERDPDETPLAGHVGDRRTDEPRPASPVLADTVPPLSGRALRGADPQSAGAARPSPAVPRVPTRRRGRPPALLGPAAAVVLTVGVVLAFVLTGDVAPPSEDVPPPGAPSGPATVAVPDVGLMIEALDGFVWVDSIGDSKITRIDPEDLSTRRVEVGDEFIQWDHSPRFGSSSKPVWISRGSTAVQRIDPASAEPGALVKLPQFLTFTVAFGSIWTQDAAGTLRRFDTDGGNARVVADLGYYIPLAATDDGIWVGGSGKELVKIDPESNTVAKRVKLKGKPTGYLHFDQGKLVAHIANRRVAVIDAKSGVVSRTFETPMKGAFATAGGGVLWKQAETSSTILWRFDLNSGRSLGVFKLPGRTAGSFTFLNGSLWVVYRRDRVRRIPVSA